MVKNHLKLALKKNRGYLILIGIMTISTMLVGMNLFDRHYTPGKIAGIIGFILLAILASVAIYLIVDDIFCKAKQQFKDTVDTNYIVRRISYTALITGTVLIGIGLFDIGNKLGDVGFIAKSLGSVLIAFSVLCLTYIVVTNSKNEYKSLYQEIEARVANSPESQKLSELDFKLQRISLFRGELSKRKDLHPKIIELNNLLNLLDGIYKGQKLNYLDSKVEEWGSQRVEVAKIGQQRYLNVKLKELEDLCAKLLTSEPNPIMQEFIHLLYEHYGLQSLDFFRNSPSVDNSYVTPALKFS